ncbi:MAG: hypothetical protein EBS53_13060 [Bacteroidetes bacterium]|nr:hypothetical protein [Bacteroidota bacterium]
MDIKRRWKSLSFKVEHLRLEVEEREEALKKFEEEFLSELSNLELEDLPGEEPKPLIAQPTIVDATGLPEEVAPADATAGPEEMKKLWKMIAAVSHPDKTKNDPKKTDLYKRAAKAWKDKSYDELYRVALELGIDPPDASEESIAVLNGISADLETKLKESETSVMWMWGTTSPEKKQGIIDIYLRSRGKKRKQV